MPDAQAVEATEQTERTEAAPGDQEQLGEGGKKALTAERARADKAEKDARDLRAQLDKIAENQLSDIDRANKTASDAQAALADANTQIARLTALAKYPVPADYQDLVTGTDAESYEASAKKLHELHARAEGKAPAPRPDPVPGSGTRTDGNPAGNSVSAGRDLFAQRHKSSTTSS